ncbi:hypothetical protein FIE12Z_5884 [Fusarium flagelliforme]|uniref:Uncharacterized protein n=1 Tax=Fusarium flagelliforme TaxID=2675880 RepID=A0A395MQX5_9HYPO|nr:hypothetical protein FIE12Z_5884 [Fusarium flagelliforme]
MGPTDFELQSVRTVTNNDLDDEPQRPRQTTGLAKGQPVLRTRRRSLWIFLFYLFILLAPWILTCVLMTRPLNRPSYIVQSGSIGPVETRHWQRLQVAIRSINTVAGVLGVPIVSCLLAHGAAVYSAVQPLIQTILVQYEDIRVVTCEGHPKWHGIDSTRPPTGCKKSWHYIDRITQTVAWDSEPIMLKFCPRDIVVQRTNYKLRSLGIGDLQAYLWSDDQSPDYGDKHHREERQTLDWHYPRRLGDRLEIPPARPYFVSSVANGTSTGVYRHHAVRMDSTAKCSTEQSFPRHCKGDMPFKTSFSGETLNVNICVEGSSNTVPWNTSRDKQEYSERMWLAMAYNDDTPNEGRVSRLERQEDNYILKCESKSRRGWFELPSMVNQDKAGRLLDKWPSEEDIKNKYNDYYLTYSPNRGSYPTDFQEGDLGRGRSFPNYGTDAFGTAHLPTPGPLMTAALAWFGNGSFFDTIRSSDKASYNATMSDLCGQSALPFFGLMGRSSDTTWCNSLWQSDRSRGELPFNDDSWVPAMENLLGNYFVELRDEKQSERFLEMAMFFANEALLANSGTPKEGRAIYYNQGRSITKPKFSVGAILTVSVLLGLQALGLCFLMSFILHSPTWTNTLDADALAQIGGQLKEWGEPRPELTQIPGVIGLERARHIAETSSVRLSTPNDDSTRLSNIHLGLGAEGLITRGALMQRGEDRAVAYR